MLKIEIATAIKQTIKQGYDFYKFKSDLTAGFIISLISLPLAMAFAIAVGLPPANGIYTAIVAGFLTSLLGGAKYQISGPAGAFVVILAPIVSKYGLNGLILAQTVGAIIIIFLAITRTGNVVNFIPHPVVIGFTSGIAIVLVVIALKDMLGINQKFSGYLIDKIIILFNNLKNIGYIDAAIAITTVITIKKSRNYNFLYLNKIPSYITAIIAAIIITFILSLFNIKVNTVSDVVLLTSGDSKNPFQLDNNFFDIIINDFNFETISGVLPAALTIGVLAALESLLAARMADNMTQTKHNPHSETLAIGISNLFSAFIMGMPATGALSRTAANIKLGAKSPVAGMISALLIYVYILLFSDLLKYVPLSCLSAILFTVAINMLHLDEIKQIIHSKHRLDTTILFTTLILTAIFDMVAGVVVGMIICFLVKIFEIANITKVDIENTVEYKKLSIKGTIFFANSSRIFNQIYRIVKSNTCQIDIDLKNASLQDTTALAELENLKKMIDHNRITVYLNEHDEKLFNKFILSK